MPWAVLLLALAATYFAWKETARLSESRAEVDFSLHAQDIRNSIANRLATYEQVLRGAKGLFAASEKVERGEWHEYVTSLGLEEHYPGIQGIGYAVLLKPGEVDRHAAEIRKQGFPEYRLYPPGRREIYTSIDYLEPFDFRNRRALGYDMWSEPARREAMERARDSGRAAMSGKVLLVQESEKDVQTGFLLYLPLYRNGMLHDTIEERRRALVGWVYSPFRMNDLMNGILGAREKQFDIEVFDGEEMKSRMFDSFERPEKAKRKALFRSTGLVEIAGHAWTVEITSLPGFEAGIDRKQRMVVLDGVAISLLVFLTLRLLATGRSRALRLAEKMNRELVESESRFRALYENVPAGVVSVDTGTGFILQANPKFQSMIGYGEGELKGMSVAQLTHPEDRPVTEKNLQKIGHGESAELRFEKRYLRKDGSVFWAEIGVTALRNKGEESIHTLAIVTDIDERKRWESALEASERRLQEIIDVMPVALFVKDPSSKILLMNRECEVQWGVTLAELKGSDGSGFFPAEQMDLFLQRDREVFSGCVLVDFEEAVWNDSLKANRIVHTYKKPVYDREGKPLYLIGMAVDITEQKEREKELRLASAVFDITDEAIVVTDPQNRVIRVNPSFTAITGYGPEEVMGRNPGLLSSGIHDRAFYEDLWTKLNSEGVWRGEIWNRRKNGEIYVEWISIKAIRDESGKIANHVAVLSDITQRREADERIQMLAYHDVLTELPNRALFEDRMHQALSQAKRSSLRLAVLFIDLDKFKPVNDNYGHEIGDLLLKEVAKRLTACVRESDTVSRLGGDEFIVLLPAVDTPSDAEKVAEKVIHEIGRPFDISGFSLSVSASVGIALYPEHGQTVKELVRSADDAMYLAKSGGGSAFHF